MEQLHIEGSDPLVDVCLPRCPQLTRLEISSCRCIRSVRVSLCVALCTLVVEGNRGLVDVEFPPSLSSLTWRGNGALDLARLAGVTLTDLQWVPCQNLVPTTLGLSLHSFHFESLDATRSWPLASSCGPSLHTLTLVHLRHEMSDWAHGTSCCSSLTTLTIAIWDFKVSRFVHRACAVSHFVDIPTPISRFSSKRQISPLCLWLTFVP